MIRMLSVTFAILLLAALPAAANHAIQGLWEGGSTAAGWENIPLRAEVVGLENETYRMQFHVGEAYTELQGLSRHDTAVFAGDIQVEGKGRFVVTARARGGVMEGLFGVYENPEAPTAVFTLNKVNKPSPTLGMKPPEGAVVLLDGTDLSYWKKIPGDLVGEALRIGGSTFVSTEEFGDAEIHVEFLCPYMPNETGQARGNSGVYVQGRYEVQVLDSFGWAPGPGTCGAIYSIAVPPPGACLPPGEWQTYDITFRAPRFDAEGKKTANAVITVKQNGHILYDNLELPHSTPGGVSGEEAAQGPLMLQDHGNPVQYRNIWFLPLDK